MADRSAPCNCDESRRLRDELALRDTVRPPEVEHFASVVRTDAITNLVTLRLPIEVVELPLPDDEIRVIWMVER